MEFRDETFLATSKTYEKKFWTSLRAVVHVQYARHGARLLTRAELNYCALEAPIVEH